MWERRVCPWTLDSTLFLFFLLELETRGKHADKDGQEVLKVFFLQVASLSSNQEGET